MKYCSYPLLSYSYMVGCYIYYRHTPICTVQYNYVHYYSIGLC